MSVMDKVFGVFRNNNTANQSQLLNGASQTVIAGNAPAMPGMQQAVNQQAAPAAQQQVAATLTPEQQFEAQFKDMWAAPTGDKPQPSAEDMMKFNMDPAKLHAAANGMDFTKTLKPEDIAKIYSDNTFNPAALVQVINQVSQSAYASALIASSAVTERAAAHTRNVVLQKDVPGLVRQQMVNEELASNPLFNNATVKPVFEMVKQQLQEKNPQMSAAEISKQAMTYVEGMSNMIANTQQSNVQGDPAQRAAAKAAKAEDFSTWET